MNKSELLSNYTTEQLAEMVLELQSRNTRYNNDRRMVIKDLEEYTELNRELQTKFDKYEHLLIPTATKEAYELIKGEYFNEVIIVTREQWDNRGKSKSEKVFLPKEYEDNIREILSIDTSEIKDDCNRFNIEGLQRYLKADSPKKQAEIDSLKEQLTRSQTTITQIDGILEELFGVKHDAVKYGEFEQFLREKVTEKVADFLPAEPIKIADMLISATHTREKTLIEKTFSKAAFGNNDDTIAENMYSVSELRQIAEHLLVYCNANM